jgi:lipoate-protein ligase B
MASDGPSVPPCGGAARSGEAGPIDWRWLGRVDYAAALELQRAERARVWAGGDGTVLVCEHTPVITLGRSANRANVLAAAGVPVVQIERGGDVTYHGPGQVVVYPIVRLRRGVVEFLSRVAAVLGDVCAAFGVVGAVWRREPAGLWLGDAKLAACGIHVARGVSMHGWALDVATPEPAWQAIRPCGLAVPQTSLARELARGMQPAPSVERVATMVGPQVAGALAGLASSP